LSSSIGKNWRISLFGESHGPAVGVVIDGLPAGIKLEQELILADMARRRAGEKEGSTKRVEEDVPRILSGLYKSRTTGSPLAAIIKNGDPHSGDYDSLKNKPRPSHADYTAMLKYGGRQDLRGGGHFSGRLTAPLVFAGAVARAYLRGRGVECGSHLYQIGGVKDTPFDPLRVDAALLRSLYQMAFPALDEEKGRLMRQEIQDAAQAEDSVGGVVECAVAGLPAGVGDPIFEALECKIAGVLFGVPAVKGVEFGAGFGFAALRGSQANDSMHMEGGRVALDSNNNGGILGGISSGAPLILRAVFKPTASIGKAQRTVDLAEKADAEIRIQGRHDSCIAVRGLAAAEAAVLLALADALPEEGR